MHPLWGLLDDAALKQDIDVLWRQYFDKETNSFVRQSYVGQPWLSTLTTLLGIKESHLIALQYINYEFCDILKSVLQRLYAVVKSFYCQITYF